MEWTILREWGDMLNRRAALLSAAILAVFFGCAVKEPTVEIVDVRLLAVTVERVKTEFVVEIDNPNSVGATVTEMRYRLFAGEVKVLDETVKEDHKIAADGKTRITLPARFATAELGAAGLLAAASKSVDYRLEIEATIQTPIGPKTFRDTQTGSMAL